MNENLWKPSDEVMEALRALEAESEEQAQDAAEARVQRVADLLSYWNGKPFREAAEALIADIESDAYPAYCPWDCDSCHDYDCPCDRLGCAGSGVELD